MKIYGKKVVLEAINTSNIKNVILLKNFSDKNFIKSIKEKNIKINYASKQELDKLVKGHHQGVVADIDEYSYTSLEEILKNDVIVMLDHIEDPHNFGAIIRTCVAAGIKSIIIPKNRAVQVNATVTKVSVGSVNHINITRVNNLTNCLKQLKEKGYWIIGTDMKGEDYKTIDYNGKIVLVIGNEGKGLSRLVQENCDYIASIPIKGKVESLNASVAAALMIYEVIRNREL